MKAIEHGEEAFTGNTERGVDALCDQRFDEVVAGQSVRGGEGHEMRPRLS